MELQLNNLTEATQAKFQLYKSILSRSDQGNVAFWDIVLLSSGDQEQKKSYEQQIALKKSRNEIPTFVKYIVVCDPVGAKIGNGGATMHALEQLQEQVPKEQLLKAKVLMVHAGGYSQRLPSVSVIGKVFLALPSGGPRSLVHMLDAILITYIDLPAKMNPGVFMTASDVIYLHNEKGDWDMRGPGITAIAHPASVDVATTHGVFILQDMEGVVAQYAKDPSQPSLMGKARCFLHKMSRQTLESRGANIPGIDQVYVDLGYYFDWPTADKLVNFYAEHKPLTCELDAYGDFLQALGPDASIEYCNNTANVTFVTDLLVETRKQLFIMLQGTPLNVAIFNQAQFNHIGTTAEYVEHLFSNPTMAASLGFQTETMVAESPDMSGKAAKRPRKSFEDCLLMHSILQERASVSVGEGCVVEFCILEPRVSIGKKCIISNLHLPSDVSIPENSYLHTVPLCEEGRTSYTTFAFDIGDSMKSSVSRDNTDKLQYCNRDMADAIKVLYEGSVIDQVLPVSSEKFSLWHSKLFPVFATRKESAEHAVNMMGILKGGAVQSDSSPRAGAPQDGRLVSVADMLKLKSTDTILEWHSSLRDTILNL